MRRRRFVLAFPLLVVACATQPMQGRADLLGFLQDGKSTREDLYLKLGPPSREFEKGRIVSWRLSKDEAGYFLVSSAATGWYGARYELVVVFTTDNVVQRHSLVEIRAP